MCKKLKRFRTRTTQLFFIQARTQMSWKKFFNKTLINYKFGLNNTDSVFTLPKPRLFCSLLTKEFRQIIDLISYFEVIVCKRISHYKYLGIPIDANINLNEQVRWALQQAIIKIRCSAQNEKASHGLRGK